MDIVIDCEIALSKKLRSLIDGSADRLVLISNDLKNGRGKGRLSLSFDGTKENLTIDAKELGETSIIIDPIEITEEYIKEGNAVVGNIFSDGMQVNATENRTPVDKIASIAPPSKGEEAYAIVAQEEIATPQEFKSIDNAECKGWITNMEDLISAANMAKDVQSQSIDLSLATTDRERSIMAASKERAESINIDAWIVNEKAATISINDLGIDLALNAPYNLSNISANKVASSIELKGLITAGFVRFISPKEIGNFMDLQAEDEEISGTLEVYDLKGAQSNMASGGSDIIDTAISKDAVEITSSDLNSGTEEENMILDLTQGMVKPQGVAQSVIEARKTSHGNAPNKPSPNKPSSSSKVKPISKL